MGGDVGDLPVEQASAEQEWRGKFTLSGGIFDGKRATITWTGHTYEPAPTILRVTFIAAGTFIHGDSKPLFQADYLCAAVYVMYHRVPKDHLHATHAYVFQRYETEQASYAGLRVESTNLED
jgi:hypothetical protein